MVGTIIQHAASVPVPYATNPEYFDVDAGNGAAVAGQLNILLNVEAKEICITFNLVDGWKVKKADFQIEFDTVNFRFNKKMNLPPGLLTYSKSYEMAPVSSTDTYCVKWEEIAGAPTDICDTEKRIYIAAHANVCKYNADGEVIQSETAWAGPKPMGDNWGGITDPVEILCREPEPETTTSPGPGNCQTAWPWP